MNTPKQSIEGGIKDTEDGQLNWLAHNTCIDIAKHYKKVVGRSEKERWKHFDEGKAILDKYAHEFAVKVSRSLLDKDLFKINELDLEKLNGKDLSIFHLRRIIESQKQEARREMAETIRQVIERFIGEPNKEDTNG